MCQDDQMLYLYTSNDNDTYMGNIFRVLSLPEDYIVKFPYQEKYITETIKSDLKNNFDENSKKYENKQVCILFTYDEKKQSPFLSHNNNRYLDIAVRYATIVKVKKEHCYIFYLKLGKFVDVLPRCEGKEEELPTLDRKGPRCLFLTEKPYLNKDVCGNSQCQKKCKRKNTENHTYQCNCHVNAKEKYEGKCTDPACEASCQLKQIPDSDNKKEKGKENQSKAWSQVINYLEEYFQDTPLFYQIEKIESENICCVPFWKKLFFIIIAIGAFIAFLYFQKSLTTIVSITIFTILFLMIGLFSYFKYKCPQKVNSLREGIKNLLKNSDKISHLPIETTDTHTLDSFFRLEENHRYWLKVHTRFNKEHPDFSTNKHNYFIEPVQTDTILSGNIEERIFANNALNTHWIAFRTHYLDIQSTGCDLIFRLHKTNDQAHRGATDNSLNSFSQPLFHLDTTIRLEAHKPFYKVIMMALMLTFIKIMIEIGLKEEGDFQLGKFIEKFTECCATGITAQGCYWDNFLVSFLVIFGILTAQHYIFKSFSNRISRIHHH